MLGDNISKVWIDSQLPFTKEASLGEILNELVDAVEAILGFSDHVGAKITHFVGLRCEARW